MDKYLDIGNSLPRTMADTSGYLMSDGKATGRVIAFSESLSVAYTVAWGGVGWGSVSEGTKKPVKMNLVAVDKAATAADGWKVKPLWNSPESELVVDDMVLTPKRIYCVGHYQRIKKDPEIWVVSREDGTVINTISITGYPSFMGMSAAGKNIFVAKREGNLLCFSGE
jgi:hypothetical protein